MDSTTLLVGAQEIMRTQGKIMPMLFLETAQSDVRLFALDTINDRQSIVGQASLFARLGWEYCKEHPDAFPVALGFYAEGWRAGPGATGADHMRPNKSAHRQEIVLASCWHEQTGVQSAVVPVLRDTHRHVTGFGTPEYTPRLTMQLSAFLQGCRDAQKPDDEVFARYHEDFKQKLAGMFPENRAAWQKLLHQEGLL